jgi:hypothetical protein
VRVPLTAILLILTAAAAGCGGGGDREPTPQQRLEQAVEDYERAVADQDCRAFARYAHSAVRPRGKRRDDPPDAAECRSLGFSYTALANFESQRVKVFGTAALVEGIVEGRFVVLVWTLDTDGEWAQVQALPGIDPQIRGQARPQQRFGPNAAAFVDAQRRGDCPRVFRLLNPAAPFVRQANDDEGRFCRRFQEGRESPERLSGQLARAPGAKPVDMGGTRDIHFFRVDTGGGRRWTLILSTLPLDVPPGEHVQDSVLDYYPTAPATG